MTEKKRQLIFLWTYREWGGAQIYLIGIMKAAQADWDIRAVMPRDSSPEILRYLDEAGVKYEFIDSYIDMDPAPTVLRKLARHWTRIHSDIAAYRFLKKFDLRRSALHIEIGPWTSWMFLTALSLRGANVFVTLHNALPDRPAWRVLLWKARMHVVSRLRGFHLFTPNKDTKNKFKGWVESRFWNNIRITSVGVDPAKIDEARRGKPAAKELSLTLGLDPTRFTVLCVGQFIDRKGRWIFLDAARTVVRTDQDIQFAWVTPMLPTEEETRKITEYGLGDSFKLILSSSIGPTHVDILRFFGVADLFVLPSYLEGLPIAILEAMAMGLPVISTNINAIPEAITDGETGVLVEPGDVDALVQSIRELKARPELRERLAAAGREFVLKNFNETETTRVALDAYKECFANEG